MSLYSTPDFATAREGEEIYRWILERYQHDFTPTTDIPYPVSSDRLLFSHRGEVKMNFPLNVKVPARDAASRRTFFVERSFRMGSLGDLDDSQIEAGVRRSVQANASFTSGSVDYSAGFPSAVVPGIRRVSAVNDEVIAEGLFLLQGCTSEWHWLNPRADLYPRYIAPFFQDRTSSHPIEWAAERMQYVCGLIAHHAGHDLPPRAAAYPYTVMANYVCNCVSPERSAKREFERTTQRDAIWQAYISVVGEEIVPEAVIFLLDNAEQLSTELVYSNTMRTFLHDLPLFLKSGLLIDRACELFRDRIAQVGNAQHALTQTTEIISGVYGSPSQPWWFKEDFDLRSPMLKQCTLDSVAPRLAREAGCAFEYARELFALRGASLLAIDGLTPEHVIPLVVQVAKDFGVGNIKRAQNVLQFVEQVLKESSASQRPELLLACRTSLKNHRPYNELLGVLEGEDVDFEKTGIGAIHLALNPLTPHHALPESELTIEVPHIEQVIAQVRRPLAERLTIAPQLARRLAAPPLLTVQREAVALLPSVRALEARDEEALLRSPLTQWLAFDNMVFAECSQNPRRVAELYLSMFALKMPNPFLPPTGFLTFLDAFLQIPDSGWQFADLEAPGPDRYSTRVSNAQRRLDRCTMIAAMLDAWAVGTIEWRDIQKTCDWILAVDIGTSPTPEDNLPENSPKTHIQEQRLARLAGVLSHIETVTGLVSARGFTAELAARSLPNFLSALREAPESAASHAFITPPPLSNAGPQRFADVVRCGILTEDNIDLRITEVGYETAVRELCDLPRRLACSEDAIKKHTERVLQSNGLSPTDYKAMRSELRDTLLLLWQDAGVVRTDEAVKRLLIDLSWWDHRLLLGPLIADFKAFLRTAEFAQSSISSNRPELVDTVDANEMIMTVWYLGAVLEDMSSIDSIPDPVVPQQRSTEVDLPPCQWLVGHEEKSLICLKSAHVMEAWKAVRAQRIACIGLLPVGGKIHVIHQIDSARLEFLKRQLGLKQTAFRLQHAQSSLILPAMPSAAELAIITSMLHREGIIDWEHPELQITIGGRLSPKSCAVLGASILLLTENGVRYHHEAFHTTHDKDTGFRIMAYDAGGSRTKLPFGDTGAGRTDMLGRRDLGDISRYQLIGSVLIHGEHGGPFADLAGAYCAKVREVLKSYHLDPILDTSWIREPDQVASATAGDVHFREAIEPCTNAWFECVERWQRESSGGSRATPIDGVIGDMKKVFDWLALEVNVIQRRLLTDPDFQAQRDLLIKWTI